MTTDLLVAIVYESDLSCWVACGRKRRKGIFARIGGSMQMLEGVVPWTTVFVIFSEIRSPSSRARK